MEHNIEVMKICVTSYLKSIRIKEKAMRDIDDKLTTTRSSLEAHGVNFDAVRNNSYSQDRFTDQIIRIVSLEDEWKEKTLAFYEAMGELLKICDPVNLNCWVCWLHWGQGQSWERVAYEIGYTSRHARRLANEGITELYSLIPEQYRRESIPNAAPA